MVGGPQRRRDWLGLVFFALLQCPSVTIAQSLAKYNLSRSVRICTASIQDFGARCNGAPAVEFEQDGQPDSPVPSGGWCAAGENFCGYDIDVWSQVADRLDLEEGVDYERICLGEDGFQYMLDSLAGDNSTFGVCDMGVSSITASTERENRGIMFSRATHRSALAVLVHAPLKQRGMWAFFEPLHFYVWMALLGTIIIIPFFVFFFEAVFARWTAYMKGERVDIASGLVQCLWHSVSHTLSIDVFRVTSLPARIVTAAYAFLVLILTNTYTANLAAFLTVNQLDTSINSVDDLRGKTVATVEPYVHRLYENHRITATIADAWDYDEMIAKLRRGDYAAVISDDTQLIGRAYTDDSCSLHILGNTIEPFDLAFAFNRNYPSPSFRFVVSSALLALQEEGVLTELKEKHEPPEPQCAAEATEFSETNQVAISSLWGLWVILGAAVAVAGVAGAAEYSHKLRQQHEDAAQMRERAAAFRSVIPKAATVGRATSAFWQTLDMRKPSRSRSSGQQRGGTAPASPKATGGLWSSAVQAAQRGGGGAADSGAPPPHAAAGRSRSEGAAHLGHVLAASRGSADMGRTLTHSDSVRSSEILDVFTCPPSMLAQLHGGSAAAVAARAACPPGSAAGRAPVSRQTSQGSAADPGSLGARSTGGRSDNLDAPVDTQPTEQSTLSHGELSTLDTALLHGLPLACIEPEVHEPCGAAGGGAGAAGSGQVAAAAELDAELDELNLIVQAVAARVAALRRTRRHRRHQQQQW